MVCINGFPNCQFQIDNFREWTPVSPNSAKGLINTSGYKLGNRKPVVIHISTYGVET